MEVAVLFIVMAVTLAIGVPIGISLALSMYALIAVSPVTTTAFIAQSMYSGVASFTMLALPFFVLAGGVMDTGGISKRIVNVANSMVGNITGGLGVVTIVACMFFGAISGSAPATVAAIGAIMIPSMIINGYDKACKNLISVPKLLLIWLVRLFLLVPTTQMLFFLIKV